MIPRPTVGRTSDGTGNSTWAATHEGRMAILLACITACTPAGQAPRASEQILEQGIVMTTESQRAEVLNWVRKAPFGDLSQSAAQPGFSYDHWFAEGRALPGSVDVLISLLTEENLERPSGDGMRIAYALGWIGDSRRSAILALQRALGSHDIALRVEAVAALGRLGDSSILPLLEALLADEREDINVRANACISIGRIGGPGTETVLRKTLTSHDKFLVRCAQEALRLQQSATRPHP